jgi:cytochrome P450
MLNKGFEDKVELKNQDNRESLECEEKVNSVRRIMLGGALSAASLALVDSLLAGCRSRSFKNGESGLTGVGADDPVLKEPFLKQWHEEYGLGVRGPALANARMWLILKWLKYRPQDMFKELRTAGVKTLYINQGSSMDPLGVNALALVVDHTTVLNVLDRPDLFFVEHYRQEMSIYTRHFILCETNGALHDAEKNILKKVLREDDFKVSDLLSNALKPKDLPAVQSSIVEEAKKLCEPLQGKAEFDVVQDVARWLPVKVVSKYFGVPSDPVGATPGSVGVLTVVSDRNDLTTLSVTLQAGQTAVDFVASERDMYTWVADSFRSLFLNLGKNVEIRNEGQKSGARLGFYITKVLQKYRNIRENGGSLGDSVLERFVVLQDPNNTKDYFGGPEAGFFRDDLLSPRPNFQPSQLQRTVRIQSQNTLPEDVRIVANMCGMIAGAIVTVEEALTNVMFVLTEPANKKWLDLAADAAKKDDYFPTLFAIYQEALRLKPQAELVPRTVGSNPAPSLEVLGELDGSGAAVSSNVQIMPGTLLLAATSSAARDNSTLSGFTNPEEFDIDPKNRPKEIYLQFGWGRHECLGKHLAPLQIVEGMRAMLLLGTLSRANGDGIQFGTNEKVKDRPGDSPYPESFKLKIN